MEPELSQSIFQSAHSFCHTETLSNILNIKEIQCEKFKSLTQLSPHRFIVAVIGKQIIKQKVLIQQEIFHPQDGQQMNELNQDNLIHGEMQEQDNQNDEGDKNQNHQYNMQQQQQEYFKLILYYIDERSTIINHLSYDQNQKIEIFPYSAKQVILVFRSRSNYSYNPPPYYKNIKLIKFVDFQTLKQITVLDNSHNMYRPLQYSEQIISFPNSRTFCFISPEDKDHIDIKYYQTQTKFNNQQPIYSTRLQQKPGQKFVKGNNSSMIIWYTETVSRYEKFIEFHYFSLEKKDKKPYKLKFSKTQEMLRCQLIQIYKIIEVGFYKFLIIFVIDRKIRIFFYDAVKNLLRQSLIQIQPSYSIQRADFIFPYLVRLVMEYTPQKIFEPVIPLFEQKTLITRPKNINNNSIVKIQENPDYRIYYLDTSFEKIAVRQKLKIFSACSHQYDIKYFNQCFYMAEQQQIVIKEHKISQNGPLACTFLILEYLGEDTDDNFIIQTLELLGF